MKLVYIARGRHLAVSWRPPIAGPVEAWKSGPVIRNLYTDRKRHGRSAVTEPVGRRGGAARRWRHDALTFPADTREVIDRV